MPLFERLTEEERRRVAAVAVVRTHSRGEQILGPGDRPSLHIVHRGRVKVYRLTESGSEQLIRILAPGDFLGETALLSDEEVDHFAVALEPGEVCTIGRREMMGMLGTHPEVAMTMLQTLSGRLHTAEQMLSSVTGQPVRQRLAGYLLQLSHDAGSLRVRLPTTKKDLASYLGTTAETLSRRLAGLQKTGLIRLGSDRTVEILDERGLEHTGSAA